MITRAAVADGRPGIAGIEDFGRGAGHISLQDHGGEVWFRSIRLRELPGEGEDSVAPGLSSSLVSRLIVPLAS